MNTSTRIRTLWPFILSGLLVCALSCFMSAQARGDQNDGEWNYYTATEVYEYQEQQVVGNGTSSITYQDTVAVGALPHVFEYEDLSITGYQERTAEYARYTLADSYTLKVLYDWTRKIVGYVDAVVFTYWDQVLVAEEREFSYWDWTPAGTTTHYAVVTEQNQTFDPASFTYLTWEQGADGVWQQVEKQQSYQIEQWYTSETELPYTVQEWEKTLKKVTYTVHHTEWVKKEVMGSYPVFERYKIYYGQTKYVYETEYVPVDYTTTLIGKVLKTVDYSTTILGTEAKELNYDTPLIGTVTNRIEYDVTERSQCEDCDPAVLEEVLNLIGQVESLGLNSLFGGTNPSGLGGWGPNLGSGSQEVPWGSSDPVVSGSSDSPATVVAEYLEASRGSSSAESWTGTGGTTAPVLTEGTYSSDAVSSESAYTTAAGLGSVAATTFSSGGGTTYGTESVAGTGSSGSGSSSDGSASSQDAAVPQATSTNVDGWHPDPNFKGWSRNDLAFISVVFAPLLAYFGLGAAFAAARQAIGSALSALWAAYGSLVAGLVTGGWRWLEKLALGSYGAFGRALGLLRGLLVNAWRAWSAFIEKLVAGLWRLLEKLESLYTALEGLYAKVAKCWPWLLARLDPLMSALKKLMEAMESLINRLANLAEALWAAAIAAAYGFHMSIWGKLQRQFSQMGILATVVNRVVLGVVEFAEECLEAMRNAGAWLERLLRPREARKR